MLISVCIPVMNRAHDLKQTLPATVAAAKASPPVEIVVLDYDSKDDLYDYLVEIAFTADHPLSFDNYAFRRSKPHKYFSISHSRNLAALSSAGEYVIIQDADIIPHIDCYSTIRTIIEQEQPVWMVEAATKPPIMGRMPVIRRDEFIASGGYDERFNVCGPEDKDICMRLHRRGGKFVAYPKNLTDEIHTSYREKFRNVDQRPYQGQPQMKLMMSRAMRKYYEENCANNVMIANLGKEWGKF